MTPNEYDAALARIDALMTLLEDMSREPRPGEVDELNRLTDAVEEYEWREFGF
jgi:hypothetical protein